MLSALDRKQFVNNFSLIYQVNILLYYDHNYSDNNNYSEKYFWYSVHCIILIYHFHSGNLTTLTIESNLSLSRAIRK